MLTQADRGIYETPSDGYNSRVPGDFTLGDLIRKKRLQKNWSQTRLGQEAARCVIRESDGPINKSTVSKVENDPYSSEFGTVWRLVAAVGLTFREIDHRIGLPFLEHKAASPTPVHKTVKGGR